MVNPSLRGFVLSIMLVILLGGERNSAVAEPSDGVGGKDWDLPAAYLRDIAVK